VTSAPSDARERTPSAPRTSIVGFARLFASVDLRSLALLRVALGLVLCLDMVGRLRLVDTLYSNDGVLTNHFSLFRPLAPLQFSLYVAASSTRDVTVVLWLTLVVYLLFTVGYRTRLFHILSFICVTGLHVRNLLAELPSDVPLHLWMAWSLVLPLGARFSIDSVRKSMKTVSERTPEELNLRTHAPRTFTSIAVFGMILQLSIVHLVPALRQDGPTWQDGSALYYLLHQNLWVTDVGAWVVEHTPVEWIRRLSYGFRGMEFAIGVLVLVPVWYFRRAAAIALLFFHLASRVLWDLGPYDWVMLAPLPLLVTSRDWDAVVRWYLRRKPALTVYFDGDCGICLFISRLLKRLDPLERLTFEKNSAESVPEDVKALASETIVVRQQTGGKTSTKSRAVAEILASLPLLKPLALALRAPGISWLVDRAYQAVSRHRTPISVWFGFDACGVPHEDTPETALPAEPIPELARTLTTLRESAGLLFLVVCGVALALRMNDDTMPQGIEAAFYSVVAYPRAYQDWKLFAPDPPKRQGTLVVEAQTARGTKIDPLTGQPPLDALDPSKRDPRSRPSPLLAAYFVNINQVSKVMYVDEMRNYIQRLGDQRDPSDKLVWFNINWIEAPIPPPEGGAPSEPAGMVPPRRITSRP